LRWAQAVLVPIAVALLLTFLLSPLVARLERPLGRIASTLTVVALAFLILGSLAWGVGHQFAQLATELPQYRANIRQKILDIRGLGKGGSLEKLGKTVEGIRAEITPAQPPRPRGTPKVAVVEPDSLPNLWSIPNTVGPVASRVATVGLVVVLVIFMLLERRLMRDRLIRLTGYARLSVTTRAVDEAAQRITRYLATQSLIATIFGAGVGVGLFLIGVPYPLVWALVAALSRFVPYVGPSIGAVAPFLVSLAVLPGWSRPLLVAGLFLGLELFTNLVLETVLYAGVAGVTHVGLLVAIAFWTWLWGPVGLLLGTPLTVCMVVAGKYVPWLRFLVTLFGELPPLEPHVGFYQHLLASEVEEAIALLTAHLRQHPRAGVLDAIVIPALGSADRDRRAGNLSVTEYRVICDAVRDIVERVSDPPMPAAPGGPAPTQGGVSVLGCGVGSEASEVALGLLARAPGTERIVLDTVGGQRLTDVLSRVSRAPYDAVCIIAVAPPDVAPVRSVCRKIKAAACPVTRIVVGRWGAGPVSADDARALLRAGADRISHTLLGTRAQLDELATSLPLEPGAPAPQSDRSC
jgi:predicted PurR-regulated permease PerM